MRRSKRLVFAICVLLYAINVHAETWITATLASKHINAESKQEEANWGVGIEQGMAKNWRAVAGMYRNSNRRDSLYFGLSWHPLRLGEWRIGAVGMFVGGYETPKHQELVKAVIPVITYEGKRWGLNVPIVPATKDNAGAIGLQAKWKW